MTVEKVKFVSVTRVIDDRKGIHYLDAVDEDGITGLLKWITNKRNG
jgi:hypothetical protein